VSLLLICASLLLLCGCSATWVGALAAGLPTLLGMVTGIAAFIAALIGKTIPADVSTEMQTITGDVDTELQNAESLISQYQSAPGTNLIAQIQAILTGVIAKLGSILSGFNITDPETLSKLTVMIGLAVEAAQALLALIPLLTAAALQPSGPALAALRSYHSNLKKAWNNIVSAKTGNPDVDAALANVKRF
jgi:hypothetical protein